MIAYLTALAVAEDFGVLRDTFAEVLIVAHDDHAVASVGENATHLTVARCLCRLIVDRAVAEYEDIRAVGEVRYAWNPGHRLLRLVRKTVVVSSESIEEPSLQWGS